MNKSQNINKKTLYIIGGTMGVGKTTVSNSLKNTLPKSVFLDGDWCWNSSPFIVNEETKKMVIENICFLINQYIKCNSYKNIIFCWVLHENSIIKDIFNRIDISKCDIKNISLLCEKNILIERLNKDIKNGKRNKEIIEKSISRIPLYDKLDTIKIDTTNKTIEEITEEIININNKL